MVRQDGARIARWKSSGSDVLEPAQVKKDELDEGLPAFLVAGRGRERYHLAAEPYRQRHGGNFDLGAGVETFAAEGAVFDSSVGCFAFGRALRLQHAGIRGIEGAYVIVKID